MVNISSDKTINQLSKIFYVLCIGMQPAWVRLIHVWWPVALPS